MFAVSGLGAQGASITQGFIADVSSAGIQHDAATGPRSRVDRWLNSDGQAVAILSRTYAPLFLRHRGVWFAVPPKAACAKVLSCPNNTPVGAGAQGTPNGAGSPGPSRRTATATAATTTAATTASNPGVVVVVDPGGRVRGAVVVVDVLVVGGTAWGGGGPTSYGPPEPTDTGSSARPG